MMRDLTEKELAKCPEGCDYYHIINNQVLFTNVLGVGVFDIHGNKVDNSILDGLFQKSKPIERLFDITQHEWSDGLSCSFNKSLIRIEDNGNFSDGSLTLNKKDAIAIAKHFNLTAEDLK